MRLTASNGKITMSILLTSFASASCCVDDEVASSASLRLRGDETADTFSRAMISISAKSTLPDAAIMGEGRKEARGVISMTLWGIEFVNASRESVFRFRVFYITK